MHTLIYAGSLKVIPAKHSSLIGTHRSTVSVLGLSDGWAVPPQPFQRGESLRRAEEIGNGKYLVKKKKKKREHTDWISFKH